MVVRMLRHADSYITPCMESSMFCSSVGRFISNHAIVGLNFVKVYVGVPDLLILETICTKSLTCVCFLCSSGNKSYLHT